MVGRHRLILRPETGKGGDLETPRDYECESCAPKRAKAGNWELLETTNPALYSSARRGIGNPRDFLPVAEPALLARQVNFISVKTGHHHHSTRARSVSLISRASVAFGFGAGGCRRSVLVVGAWYRGSKPVRATRWRSAAAEGFGLKLYCGAGGSVLLET